MFFLFPSVRTRVYLHFVRTRFVCPSMPPPGMYIRVFFFIFLYGVNTIHFIRPRTMPMCVWPLIVTFSQRRRRQSFAYNTYKIYTSGGYRDGVKHRQSTRKEISRWQWSMDFRGKVPPLNVFSSTGTWSEGGGGCPLFANFAPGPRPRKTLPRRRDNTTRNNLSVNVINEQRPRTLPNRVYCTCATSETIRPKTVRAPCDFHRFSDVKISFFGVVDARVCVRPGVGRIGRYADRKRLITTKSSSNRGYATTMVDYYYYFRRRRECSV